MSLSVYDAKLLKKIRYKEDCEELLKDVKIYINGMKPVKWNLIEKMPCTAYGEE